MNTNFLTKIKGAFHPVEYTRWEMFIMRALLGVAVWYAFQKIQTFPEARYEIGIGNWMDVSVFHDATLRSVSSWVIAICMISYAFGFLPWVVLPIAAFLFIGPATLNTSQGKIHHHLHAGAAVLTILACWHIIAALVRLKGSGRLTRLRTFQLSVFFVLQTVAAAYIVSAATKLDKSGLGWFTDTKYAPVAIRKTEDSSYFSTLEVRNPEIPLDVDEESGDGATPQFAAAIPRAVQRVILDHPWSGAWILGPGLVLELFAFLALLGRGWAFIIGASFISFHFLVGHIMNLHFELNNHILIIFFLNLPYWLVLIALKLSGKNTAPSPAPS